LKLLDVYHFTNGASNRIHTMLCNGPGQAGFSKVPGSFPDVLHSYFGLAGLSLIGLDGLAPIDPSMAITQRAAENRMLEVFYV